MEYNNTFSAVSDLLSEHKTKNVSKEKLDKLDELCGIIDGLAVELEVGIFDVVIDEQTLDITISLGFYDLKLTDYADIIFYLIAHTKDFYLSRGETHNISGFGEATSCNLNFVFPSVFE